MPSAPTTAPSASRRPGSRAVVALLSLGLAALLCVPFSPLGHGQTTSPTDLPADAPTPATTESATNPDGSPTTPVPTPTATPPPSSLLIDPGATPVPLPSPNLSALPRTGTPQPTILAPPPPGAGGPLPADAPAAGPDLAASATGNPNDVRRFRYNFRLTLGATYNDNILLTRNGAISDVYFTISPSVILGYGDIENGSQSNFISFSYSPEALLYVEHTEEDALQHFIHLNGIYHLTQITLTGSQDINILNNSDFSQVSATGVGGPASGGGGGGIGGGTSQPVNNVNLDARRTRVNIYNTSLGANYAYSDKTSFDLGLQLSIADYQTLISSETYAGNVFVNYAITGKITAGLGISGGYVQQDDPSPNETFEQVNLRLSYQPSQKFSFNGQVGVDVRQQDGANGSEINPIFTLSANYAPFDSTTVALSATRQVLTSAVDASQDFTTTNITLSLSQRFFQKLFARFSVGYINSTYDSQTNSAAVASPPSPIPVVTTPVAITNAGREDNYFFIQPSLDYNLRDNLSVGAFYIYRDNNSSQSFSSFKNNQIGAHVSYSF